MSAGARGSVAAGAATPFRLSHSLGAVIELVQNSDYDEATFEAFADIHGTVYDTNTNVTLEASARLDAAVEAKRSEIGELRAAIAANAALGAWLDAHGVDASSVIAVGLQTDGSLAFFTR